MIVICLSEPIQSIVSFRIFFFFLVYYPLQVNHSVFFKKIIIQLLSGLEEAGNVGQLQKEKAFTDSTMDGTICFIGTLFARICRRGSSGVNKCFHETRSAFTQTLWISFVLS